jgi:predicted amidohydrolase YtcJ
MKKATDHHSSLVLHNANIITMDPKRPRADAVVIREGRIVAVGNAETIASSAEDVADLNLNGRTVLPGFIDSHAHLTWTGMKETALDFSPASTVADVQEILAQTASGTETGRLILGMGLNHYLFPNRQLPTAEDLDAAAPSHPAYIVGVTGHYSVANSHCRDQLNLPTDAAGLDPSGVLRGRANTLAGRELRGRFAREQGLERLYGAASKRAVSVGLTTVHALEGSDQPRGETEVKTLLGVAPELPIRLVVWYQTTDVSAAQALGLNRVGGCILLDGDFGPHTAALTEPYVDQPGNRGTLYYTQDQVNEFVENAHRAGMQIAMHAVGDRAAEQALIAYERAVECWPRQDHRHRIEHFEVFNAELVKRARNLGIHLAIQPPFNVHLGGHTRLNPILGEERALRSDPVRSLIEAGVAVGGGSDSTVTPLNPLYGVHCAVNHSNPSERLGTERALQLYTLDNAALAFEEGEKGSIEVGKLGDLAVLSADPLAVEPNRIQDIHIEYTILGGEIVYQRSKEPLT